jgi:hypothetical protein
VACIAGGLVETEENIGFTLWILEIWAHFASSAFFSMIFILLAVLNGKVVLQGYGLSLDAIAPSTMAMKAYLFFSVTEGIG